MRSVNSGAIRTVLLTAATAFTAAVLLQCSNDETKPTPPNERPIVQITSGGASSDSAGIDYRVDFTWEGHDPDGTVAGFEWAVDDTLTESAWQRTRSTGEHVDFTADTPVPGSDSLFADWHAFYVRSVDNDSARSVPDHRYFSARTIAPVSRITRPDLSQSTNLILPRSYRVEWTGEDADGPEGKPVAYEYKLVAVPLVPYPPPDTATYRSVLLDGENVMSDLTGEAKKQWIRVAESVHSVQLDSLATNTAYIFGVRAIDAAGAVEPRLDLNRNVFAFLCDSNPPVGSITITEPRLGRFVFPDYSDIWQISMVAGITLGFSWQGTSYDGSELEWNYAFDIPDPGDDDLHNPQGIGGWIGWGDWSRPVVPIRFEQQDAGTTHFLYVRMRSIGGGPSSERRAIVRFDVQRGPTFEKFALLVDDARFAVGVSDRVHDQFLDNVFLRRLRDYGEVDKRSIFDGPTETGSPGIISLAEMGEYQLVIWSGEPASARNGIGRDLFGGRDNNNTHLGTYLEAGGKVFFFGRIVGMERSDFGYPVSPPTWSGDPKFQMLYYRFLHLHDWIVASQCAGHPICDGCYSEVSSLLGARSLIPAFPDLTLDLSKWDPWHVDPAENRYRGGILAWEGSMHLGDGSPEQIPGLDSLYAAVTWDRSIAQSCNVRSQVSGAICGLRYESTPQDTLQSTTQGRAMVFLFQPYWFQPDQIQSAGTAAIDWLVNGK